MPPIPKKSTRTDYLIEHRMNLYPSPGQLIVIEPPETPEGEPVWSKPQMAPSLNGVFLMWEREMPG